MDWVDYRLDIWYVPLDGFHSFESRSSTKLIGASNELS